MVHRFSEISRDLYKNPPRVHALHRLQANIIQANLITDLKYIEYTQDKL